MPSLIEEPQRPRKPWRVDWVDRGQHRTMRFATKREARVFLGDLERGGRPQQAERMTLTAWLETWLTTSGVAWEARTRHDRADYIDRLIVPHLGKLKIGEIGRADVRAWRAALLRRGSTPYVADRAVTVLSAALGAAVDDELIPANPCRGLKRLPRPVKRRIAAEPAEVERIRAAMTSARDRAMLSLMAYAGLRPSEVRALRWEDIGERAVVVRAAMGSDGREKRTKTGSERSVPIITPLREDLDALRAQTGATRGLVTGEPVEHHNWASRVWRPARAAAGSDASPYALRHTFASLLIAEGRNAWQVATLMGHSNPQMVITTYGHLFAEAELAEPRSMEQTALAARHAASSMDAASAAK